MPTLNDPRWETIAAVPGTVDCPACGQPIPLEPRLNKSDPKGPPKLVGRHDCLGLPDREVYETDAPAEGPLASPAPATAPDVPALPGKE